MTKQEAEEYFKAEIGDCPFKVFYCFAIAGLYENKKDNPGRLLVIWSEEDKAFSFTITNHEVFMPENFVEELEKLKEADSIVWSSDKIYTEEEINKNIKKINKKYNVFDEKEAENDCDN